MSLATALPKGYKASTYADGPQTAQIATLPLPAGMYTVEITNATVAPLKSGKGTGLTLEFTVIDPAQHARRKVWHHLNIQHENEMAQDIALRDLSQLCQVIGMDEPDENEFFQKVLRIRTAIAPARGIYESKAEVKGYEPAGTVLPDPRPPLVTRGEMNRRLAQPFADMDSDIPY